MRVKEAERFETGRPPLEEQGHAASRGHHPEGCDERSDPAARHHNAVDAAADTARENPQHHGHRHSVLAGVRERGRYHSAESHHGAEREVHAAGEQNERNAHSENAVDRDLAQQVHQVRYIQEIGPQEREHRHQHSECYGQIQFRRPGSAPLPFASRRGGGRRGSCQRRAAVRFGSISLAWHSGESLQVRRRPGEIRRRPRLPASPECDRSRREFRSSRRKSAESPCRLPPGLR